MPDIGAAGKAFLSVGLVWTVSSVVEFLVYTPMLGAGGGYLAFITGNLINMKIPCAVNARDIVGAKPGAPENAIVSTLSIATSSLVTIIVLALGVALLVPLQPVLQSPTLQPAFENVVPALFGAMAYKYFRGNMKIAAAPLIVMSILFHPGALPHGLDGFIDNPCRCARHRHSVQILQESRCLIMKKSLFLIPAAAALSLPAAAVCTLFLRRTSARTTSRPRPMTTHLSLHASCRKWYSTRRYRTRMLMRPKIPRLP